MTFNQIITIAGKPGLYEILTQNKSALIVQSLTDKKRFQVTAAHNINTLQDIAIYTYDKDIPLRQVFLSIFNKEKGKTSISPKSQSGLLNTYFREILPEYDEERVYTSNIKKVISWYNLLVANDFNFKDLEETEDNIKTDDSKKE